jgi:putative tricarboxylic transport membrane protein
MSKRAFIRVLALTAALAPATAFAERATVMIPATPGGGWDSTARMTMQVLEDAKIFNDGALFINKGGAGGTIALAEFVMANKRDDNAIMVMGSIMISAIIANKSPVTLDDAVPLARLTREFNAVAVQANSPFKSVADLVNAIKTKPGGTPLGGGGVGGIDHATFAMIAATTGTSAKELNYLPFAGGAEVATALGSGQVVAAISGLSELKPLADSGRIKILAVTGEERIPGVDIPTLREQGVDVVMSNWRGLMGAAGMSEKGKAMWNDRLVQMSKSPEWKETLKKRGFDDAFLAGKDFEAFVDAEKESWAKAIADIGIGK